MKLILNKSEFELIVNGSTYNHNYYLNKEKNYVILEICYEDFNCSDFFLIEGEEKVFLGSSNDGFGIGDGKNINIDFKTQYT